METRFVRYRVAIAASALAVGTWACATAPRPANLQSLPRSEPGAEYKIRVGDELDIKFQAVKELNEHVVVRPDGRISLQLVPEIVTAGLTPRQLKERLEEAYRAELSEPTLTVSVGTFGAERIYVTGEVRKPGELRLVGTVTALQAVTMAGMKGTAGLSDVVVIRRAPDRTPQVIRCNLRHAIDGTDRSQDITLMPYDVLLVPKSTLARVNIQRLIDELIGDELPIRFGFVLKES